MINAINDKKTKIGTNIEFLKSKAKIPKQLNPTEKLKKTSIKALL